MANFSQVWCPLVMFLVYPPAGLLYGVFMCCVYDRRRRTKELMEMDKVEKFLAEQADEYASLFHEGAMS